MTQNMIELSILYTGIKTHDGVKIYLGDKLVAPFYFPMVVQFDFKESKFVLTTTGKNKSPYRNYLLEDMALNPSLRIISNSLIYQSVKVSDLVKITVNNIKDSLFKEGDTVKVVEVNEWNVVVQSLSNENVKATIQFYDFLEMWRYQEF